METKNVPAITDLPIEWKKVEVLAKEAAEKKLICFPDEWVNDARNKKVQPVPWQEITGKAMCEAVGADAAIAFSCGTLRKRHFTELDMYNMIRNEFNIVKLTFTPEQLKTLLAQLPQLKTRIYGLDVENLPKRNISIAVDAYDVTGCDGAYPALRIIANKIPTLAADW